MRQRPSNSRGQNSRREFIDVALIGALKALRGPIYRSPLRQEHQRSRRLVSATASAKRNRTRRTLPVFPDHSYISDLSFADDGTRHYLQTDDEDDDLQQHDGPDYHQESDDEDDDDGGDDLFRWEEETTLVAELLKEGSSDNTSASLVNELKGPMSAQNQNLKICIAEGLVPAVNLVRQAHRRIDQVDVTLGNGVLTFNQSCKAMERVMVHGRNAIVAAYMKLRQNEERLFAELGEAYAKRDKLWVDLEQSMNQSADSALSKLKDVPTSIERMIAAVEKQSKDLDNDTADSAKADKLIRELFERLA